MKHTLEPLRAESAALTGGKTIFDPQNHDIAYAGKGETADRIVACVNALAGIENPDETLKLVREALRDALTEIEIDDREMTDPIPRIRAALVSLGGGKP